MKIYKFIGFIALLGVVGRFLQRLAGCASRYGTERRRSVFDLQRFSGCSHRMLYGFG